MESGGSDNLFFPIPIQDNIVVGDNVVTTEDLPFPLVHYGRTFFGFRADENSPIVLCSCAREAIENYIAFAIADRLRDPGGGYADPTREFILDSYDFPRALVQKLMDSGAPDNEKVMDHLLFQDKLCHECNAATPKYRCCHEMYGGAFVQHYGWYISKQSYEFGVEPGLCRTLPERCPEEIRELVKIDTDDYFRRYRELKETGRWEEAYALDKEHSKQSRLIMKVIENEVRQKFGHRKVGEAWTSETILYHMVCSVCPHMTVLRHYRPAWLQGLELDIFIEEVKVAIEYQGIQHFEPVAHWGGKKGLERLQDRDERKSEICGSLNIPLLYFYHDEVLSEDLVSAKLKKHMPA